MGLKAGPSPPKQLLDEATQTLLTLDCNLVRDLEVGDPAKPFLIPGRNYEIINMCIFKLVSFGVICYTAVSLVLGVRVGP